MHLTLDYVIAFVDVAVGVTPLRFQCFPRSKREDRSYEAQLQIINLGALWPLIPTLVEPDIDFDIWTDGAL